VGGQFAQDAGRFLEGTLDAAAERNVPIWSALDWLEFTELRHDAGLDDLRWDAASGALSFQLAAATDPDVELTVMVPQRHVGLRLARLEVDGQTVTPQARQVGGLTYAWAAVAAGPHHVTAHYAS
jgi:hypothetical protein